MSAVDRLQERVRLGRLADAALSNGFGTVVRLSEYGELVAMTNGALWHPDHFEYERVTLDEYARMLDAEEQREALREVGR